jgi:hypothetical protein
VKIEGADCKGRGASGANALKTTRISSDHGWLFTTPDDAAPMTVTAPPLLLPPDALHAQFPALRRLLGEPAFERLAALALEHSAAQGVPADSPTGVPPRAFVHGLLVHGDVAPPDGTPPRLLADVAALEAALADLAALAPRAQHQPRLQESALAALPPDVRERTALRPTRALRLVPVAFRLAGWLREVREGKQPRAPRRGEQHVVLYVLPALPSLSDAPPVIWWHGLAPTEGRLLSRIALGTRLGPLHEEARAQGWTEGATGVDAWIGGWIREGLFSELVTGGAASEA